MSSSNPISPAQKIDQITTRPIRLLFHRLGISDPFRRGLIIGLVRALYLLWKRDINYFSEDGTPRNWKLIDSDDPDSVYFPFWVDAYIWALGSALFI